MTDEREVVGRLLDWLFAERGLPTAVRFGTQQEGRLLPGVAGGPSVESLSGFAIASGGDVYRFWLDWDRRRKRHVLKPFGRVLDLGVLASDPEYLAARRRIEVES